MLGYVDWSGVHVMTFTQRGSSTSIAIIITIISTLLITPSTKKILLGRISNANKGKETNRPERGGVGVADGRGVT
mgnify:CR=1 FL=1|jgi:hypothetical protein